MNMQHNAIFDTRTFDGETIEQPRRAWFEDVKRKQVQREIDQRRAKRMINQRRESEMAKLFWETFFGCASLAGILIILWMIG